MITFSQLNQGDEIHVLEVTGTFRKSTNYFLGKISAVSSPYDEPIPPLLFPMQNQLRRKLVDITITCDGEQKKLAVEEGKSIIKDNSIGLTVSTNKQLIVDMIKSQYDDYKTKKEAITRYDEEMAKCEGILKQLDYKEPTGEDPRISELQNEITELKNIIKQASNMVPPLMKLMLPLNMQNVILEAS